MIGQSTLGTVARHPRRTGVIALLVLCALGLLFIGGATGQPSQAGENVTFEFDGEGLESGPDQTIRGETDMELELLSVVVRTVEGPEFEYERPVVVDRSGQFETAIDLSPLRPETPAEITLKDEGEVLGRTQLTVLECRSSCQPDSGPTLELDDSLDLEAGPQQLIGGQTSVDPGTWFQGEIQQGEERLRIDFITTYDGTFVTAADLSELTPNQPATVSVRWAENGEVAESMRTVEITCANDCGHGTSETASDSATGGSPTGDAAVETAQPQPATTVGEQVGEKRILRQFDEPLAYGETTQIPVDLSELEGPTIELYGTTGLEATLELEDRTGTDRVTVAFDTHPRGTNPLFFAADPDDVVTATQLQGAVSPGPVSLQLHDDGQLVDSAQLELVEPSEPIDVVGNDATSGEQEEPSDRSLLPLGLFALAALCAGTGVALLAGWLEW